MGRRLALAVLTGIIGCQEQAPPLRASSSEIPVYEAAIAAALFTPWGADTLQFAPEQPASLIILDQVEHRRWEMDPEGHRRWLQGGMPILPSPLVDDFVHTTVPPRALVTGIRTPAPTTRHPAYSDQWPAAAQSSGAEVIGLGPVFFGPDSTALVEIARYVEHGYGSRGILFFMKRTNGTWQVISSFEYWVS